MGRGYFRLNPPSTKRIWPVVKEALNMMGLPGGRCRRPIQPLSEDRRAQLRDILVGMGLIQA